MKVFATTAALAAAYVLADDDVETTTEAAVPVPTLEPRRFHSIVTMAYSQVTTSLTKNVFEEKIRKYGCHCFPLDTKSAGGQGPAVDAMDSLCKKLYKCHKCINLEFGVEAIDVNQGKYTWQLDDQTGLISCDKNAQNPARKALCECDREYAYHMKNLWDDNSFNGFYWKNNKWAKQNPTFDFDNTCMQAGGSGSGGKADMCCGDAFPNKEPYDSSQKACCGSTIFNAVTQTCCAADHIASPGSC